MQLVVFIPLSAVNFRKFIFLPLSIFNQT